MNQAIHELKQQLFSGSMHGMESLLQVLYDGYVNTAPEDQEQIKDGFRKLRAILQPMSFLEQEQICDIVTALCAEHDRIAFLDGVRIGARLILELSE